METLDLGLVFISQISVLFIAELIKLYPSILIDPQEQFH